MIKILLTKILHEKFDSVKHPDEWGAVAEWVVGLIADAKQARRGVRKLAEPFTIENDEPASPPDDNETLARELHTIWYRAEDFAQPMARKGFIALAARVQRKIEEAVKAVAETRNAHRETEMGALNEQHALALSNARRDALVEVRAFASAWDGPAGADIVKNIDRLIAADAAKEKIK